MIKFIERNEGERPTLTLTLTLTLSVGLWCQRSNLFQNIPITNNAVEGWHNAFRSSFGSLNKTDRNFVKKLRDENEKFIQKWLF